MKIRVYYEDTDAGGIVYHANYIKYCERARSEIFFTQGLTPFEDKNSGFVVRNIEASFLAIGRLGDLLEVRSKVIEQKNSSIMLNQEVYRDKTQLFAMDITLVYVKNGKPCRIPEVFRKLFTNHV